jgi:hypothetical protein
MFNMSRPTKSGPERSIRITRRQKVSARGQGGLAGRRRVNPEALGLEVLDQHLAAVGIVVDDENRTGERRRIHEAFSEWWSSLPVAFAGFGRGPLAPSVNRA